jgi:predicted dehydrogenase
VELVVNLTPPRAHRDTTRALLLAGKHVYSEKPLAIEVDEGRELVKLARARGLGLGCAPDTFLGSAFQTAHDAVREGMLGEPFAAAAFVGNSGPEAWHPTPAAYYEPGAGPLFSLGPYYLTALVQLLGPIAEARGFSTRPAETRRLVDGTALPISTDTTYVGALRFTGGAIASLVASYDIQAEQMILELYGSRATLTLTDPNQFDGRVLLNEGTRPRELPPTSARGRGRGVGVADLARSVAAGVQPRASGTLALHVLDAMCALTANGRTLTTSL